MGIPTKKVTVSIPETLLPDFRVFTVLHGGAIEAEGEDMIDRKQLLEGLMFLNQEKHRNGLSDPKFAEVIKVIENM